jgi:hypothetical protein
MQHVVRSFGIPTAVSAACLAGVWAWLGLTAFFTALLLVILEITLSFDNAVVNAKVLERMTPKWQRRFLTWGIFIAVFLTRAVLPILIVSASVVLSPWVVAKMALFDPGHYGELLESAKYTIYSFGGIFLTMVALKYFFDSRKERHWLHWVEKHLSKWGNIEAIEIALALSALALVAIYVPGHELEILLAGIVGIVLFIIVQGIANSFAVETSGAVASAGLALFVYLNILDAAFSLDSVVGAFALSTQLPIIIVGLGIGAYFVRALTVYMVEKGTLDALVYIEHGAHWAILGLALAMLASMFVEVPEPVTGLIGLSFLIVAYISSVRTNNL